MDRSKVLNLRPVGLDQFRRPMFRDERGDYWVDVDYDKGNYHRTGKKNGEPCCPPAEGTIINIIE